MAAGAATDASHTLADVAVHMAIIVLGGLQFVFTLRASDFVAGDVTYYELARSIVEGRTYGFNARIETLLPPGFPALLALLCVTVGSRYSVLIRSMPVFGTLGFMVSYELLRRQVGRAVAAAACLLLISSTEVFGFSTSLVLSDIPYFLASTLVLLLVMQLDKETPGPRRTVKWLLLCLLLPASVMLRSAGVTLLTGLAAWLATSFLSARALGARRATTFLVPLLLGLLVQGVWMEWGRRHEVIEWPIGGYPRSYSSQLLLESGNEPELGRATLGGVGLRVARNVVDRAANVVDLLARRGGTPEWSSPAVSGTVALIVAGVADSIDDSSANAFLVWYYLGHETIYLLWPWDFEERFFLPVLPLTCLFLWRGARVIMRLVATRPKPFGRACVVPALVLVAGSFAWQRRSGGTTATLAFVFWTGGAALATWLAWNDSEATKRRIARCVEWAAWPVSWIPRGRVNRTQALATTALVGLVGLGLADQLEAGERHLHFDVTRLPSSPSIEAGRWIRDHSPASVAVMARERELVYHYAARRVVWFPPISDPGILMDGIRRHAVDLVVVTDGRFNYWRPTDRTCFDRLLAAQPGAFTLLHEGPGYRIFSVSPKLARSD